MKYNYFSLKMFLKKMEIIFTHKLEFILVIVPLKGIVTQVITRIIFPYITAREWNYCAFKLINTKIKNKYSSISWKLYFLIVFFSFKDGEEATILSPLMPYYGVSCLSVSYYVIGIAQWDLSLSITDPANNNFKLLWSSRSMKEIKGRSNRIMEEINVSFEMIQVRGIQLLLWHSKITTCFHLFYIYHDSFTFKH